MTWTPFILRFFPSFYLSGAGLAALLNSLQIAFQSHDHNPSVSEEGFRRRESERGEEKTGKVKPQELGTEPKPFLKSLVRHFLASLHNNSTSFSLT